MKPTKLVQKKCYITNKDSIYYGEWGIITAFDGDAYYVAIAGEYNSQPTFYRDEFVVRRNKKC